MFRHAAELVLQIERATRAFPVEERLGFLASSDSEKLVAGHSTLIRGLQALVVSLDGRA